MQTNHHNNIQQLQPDTAIETILARLHTITAFRTPKYRKNQATYENILHLQLADWASTLYNKVHKNVKC